MAKKKKPQPEPDFKEGQKVKRIDIFRLFDDKVKVWKRWDKKKGQWKKVPFKSEVKDLDFKITQVKECDSGWVLLKAESKNWRMRWLKKSKDDGWGFLSVLKKDLLKDNDILK